MGTKLISTHLVIQNFVSVVWLVGQWNSVGWLWFCRNLMGCMDRHGTVLWGLVLGLLWPILLEDFYISPWIKNYTSSYLRPLYIKQLEAGWILYCSEHKIFGIHFYLRKKKKKGLRVAAFLCTLPLLQKGITHFVSV